VAVTGSVRRGRGLPRLDRRIIALGLGRLHDPLLGPAWSWRRQRIIASGPRVRFHFLR